MKILCLGLDIWAPEIVRSWAVSFSIMGNSSFPQEITKNTVDCSDIVMSSIRGGKEPIRPYWANKPCFRVFRTNTRQLIGHGYVLGPAEFAVSAGQYELSSRSS